MQAAALRRLGVIPVRGSGGHAGRAQRKGGAPALRGLLRALEDGASVAMTADVAKVARVAGLGIVTLARLSGRPILPMAVMLWEASFGCRMKLINHCALAPSSARCNSPMPCWPK